MFVSLIISSVLLISHKFLHYIKYISHASKIYSGFTSGADILVTYRVFTKTKRKMPIITTYHFASLIMYCVPHTKKVVPYGYRVLLQKLTFIQYMAGVMKCNSGNISASRHFCFCSFSSTQGSNEHGPALYWWRDPRPNLLNTSSLWYSPSLPRGTTIRPWMLSCFSIWKKERFCMWYDFASGKTSLWGARVVYQHLIRYVFPNYIFMIIFYSV